MANHSGRGPLSDVTVVELAGIGPVPFAGMMLRQMGATVLQVDKPGGLDAVIPVERDLMRRGKERTVIDLSRASGVARLLELVEQADILLEGYRPGVLERLGAGPSVCLARNPAVVIGRMTGWGQDGPLAGSAGHDLNYIGATGALQAIGPASGPPQIPLNLVGDYGGGALYLVTGVLAALHERSRTGQGQVVDAAIVDGATHLLSGVYAAMAAGLWENRRAANFMDGGHPCYGVYETADGMYMTVTAVESRFSQEFFGVLGLPYEPDAVHDRAQWPRIRSAVARVFATRSRAEWTELFAGTDACVEPVFDLVEAAGQPQIAARGTLTNIDGAMFPAPAPRFSRWSDSRGL